MKPRATAALAYLLAAAGCATAVRPIARTGRFRPTVMYAAGVPEGSAGEYLHTKLVAPGGGPAAFAEVIELIEPGREGDPLAASPADSADSGFLDAWHRRAAGVVVERRQADEKGFVSLAFEVGLRARPYAYTGALAGAGESRAASLITRPENVYGNELRLVPATAVLGDVVDESGEPVRGAFVRIAFRVPSCDGPLVLMTACDDDGAFALPPIPAGDAGDPVTLRADADGGRSARVDLTPEVRRAGPVRVVLPGPRAR